MRSSPFMMHETLGNLEYVQTSAAGAGVSTNFIQNFNSATYLASYIQPGSYRVRWVPMSTTMVAPVVSAGAHFRAGCAHPSAGGADRLERQLLCAAGCPAAR